MKTTTFAALALAATLTSSKAISIIDLFEFALNIDGTVQYGVQGDPLPSGSTGSFDTTTGLGTLTVTIGSGNSGSHYIGLYVDHEIDQLTNTYFNETGSSTGTPAVGQSWEIDEPGFLLDFPGDIYDNFLVSALDNQIFSVVPLTTAEDVSMAIGWDLSLASWQSATVSFTLSESVPNGGFFLTQTDPDSGGSVYFSSGVTIAGTPPGTVPDGGSTLALLLCACGGLVGLRTMRNTSPQL